MNRFVKPYKIVIIFVLLAMVLSIYSVALYDLQIENADRYTANAISTTTTSYVVEAARGDILDRNGVLLVSSRASYNIILTRLELLNSGEANSTIEGLIDACEEAGVEYNDSFPMTDSAPFTYPVDMTSSQKARLAKYLEYFGLDEDISASDLFVWMKKHYSLDYTTSIVRARKIMGIRYELEIRAVMNTTDYVFANDVSVDFIADIMQRNYTGVHVETGQVREYHTDYAAHILGYTAAMDSDEYEVYKEFGYPMDAVIGQSGIEAAFENVLHGTEGKTRITTDSEGNVVNEENVTEPIAGSNVFLTLDIKLQEAAEKALSDVISEINTENAIAAAEGDEEAAKADKAEGGAVVVEKVNTGEILAAASYPTYSLSTLNEDWALIEQSELQPMFNRVTQGQYNPGSTFKMITAFAGLRSYAIDLSTTVEDRGIYEAYEDYTPKCWIYPGNHGRLNVIGALAQSCNYFFYWLGDIIGADAITEAKKEFGLGEPTGLEINEKPGTLYTPEYKKERWSENWYAADTLLTSIGQTDLMTPMQIANYTSTVANGGTRYKTTLLKEIDSYDYASRLYKTEPVVNHKIDDKEGYIPLLQDGMKAVASYGTASSTFGNYKVKIACKTGTVQSDTSSTNTGVFVCYAPADDPEIAIAVVVEHGVSGSTVLRIAQRVLDFYFEDRSATSNAPAENTLLK